MAWLGDAVVNCKPEYEDCKVQESLLVAIEMCHALHCAHMGIRYDAIYTIKYGRGKDTNSTAFYTLLFARFSFQDQLDIPKHQYIRILMQGCLLIRDREHGSILSLPCPSQPEVSLPWFSINASYTEEATVSASMLSLSPFPCTNQALSARSGVPLQMVMDQARAGAQAEIKKLSQM